jgi:hypothetical protein
MNPLWEVATNAPLAGMLSLTAEPRFKPLVEGVEQRFDRERGIGCCSGGRWHPLSW